MSDSNEPPEAITLVAWLIWKPIPVVKAVSVIVARVPTCAPLDTRLSRLPEVVVSTEVELTYRSAPVVAMTAVVWFISTA